MSFCFVSFLDGAGTLPALRGKTRRPRHNLSSEPVGDVELPRHPVILTLHAGA